MTDRAALIVDRINERLAAICAAVPPIDPPAQHWLDSDCGPSYCGECVDIARGHEFELGPLLHPMPNWARDRWEEAFFDGIDGGYDSDSDSSAHCEICQKPLSYILTDYGVQVELSYYREQPLSELRDEDSYALDRLCLNIFDGSPRRMILDAAIVINQAWRLLSDPKGDPA